MISKEALAAAYEKAWPYSDDTEEDLTYMLKLALEAAAPLIASPAWDQGFTACNAEYTKQRQDPTYPIHRTNPYGDLL